MLKKNTKKIIVDRFDFVFGTVIFPLFALIIALIFDFFQNKFEKNGIIKSLLDICAPILIYMLIINLLIYFKCSSKDNNNITINKK